MIEETHTATVTSTDDPEQRLRIRCSCVGILADEDGELPMWIEPELDWGWVLIPDVGEIVEIVVSAQDITDDSFGQSSIDAPNVRWRGARHWSDRADGENPRPVPNDFKTNYGKRRGFVTPAGHIFLFDDTNGAEKINISHYSQKDQKHSFISIDEDGSIVLSNKNGSLIYLNAAQAQIAIIDEHGNSYTTDEDGIRLIDKNSNIVEMKSGDVTILSQGNVTAMGNNFNAKTATYTLGDGAAQSTVLGEALLAWINTHTHSTGMGPSGPPIVPAIPADFLSTAGKLL